MRRIRSKWIVGFVLWAIVLQASIVSFLPSTASAAPASPTTCSATELRVTYDNILVGLGHANVLFWITNLSNATCTLSGFPSIGFRTSQRGTLRVATHDAYGNMGNFVGGIAAGRVLPTVTLAARGGTASFWTDGIDLVGAGGTTPSSCFTTRVMTFRAPGSSSDITVHSRHFYDWCGELYVMPILPGKSGSLPAKPLSYFFGTPSG
jgi:hypothetical protein